MAKALGRREDETSDPQSQRRGPERWLLILVALVAVAIVGALIAFAH
jgi:flagellar basal body-associated protein FliL